MLWESSAFHLVPFHCKKKTVSPGLTRAAAHSVSPTFAQVNSCMVAPPGRADKIACEEQSALKLETFELVVGLLLGVSFEFDDEDPQAEKARTSARTGTTVRLRRTRLLRALGMRRDRAVVDDKGVLRRARGARVWVDNFSAQARSSASQ
jgi:hypothetical protein